MVFVFIIWVDYNFILVIYDKECVVLRIHTNVNYVLWIFYNVNAFQIIIISTFIEEGLSPVCKEYVYLVAIQISDPYQIT